VGRVRVEDVHHRVGVDVEGGDQAVGGAQAHPRDERELELERIRLGEVGVAHGGAGLLVPVVAGAGAEEGEVEE